ncbi:MAG: nickel insertion protein, partial [Haloarculaceae archaeon]
MRTLALEGRMGASGDMLLGALLAAGADREALAPVEDALDVRYVVDRTTKNGIEATAVTVVLVDDSHEGSGTDGHDHSPGDGHDHSPGDGHDHSPSDGH